MPEGAYGVTIAGQFAYVAGSPNGLIVLDIREPTAPRVVGALGSPSWAYAVTVAGPYAYLSATSSGMAIVRIRFTGDVNGDDHVDLVDLLTLADAWGKSSGEAGYRADCDFDNNGAIEVVDLLYLADTWGT